MENVVNYESGRVPIYFALNLYSAGFLNVGVLTLREPEVSYFISCIFFQEPCVACDLIYMSICIELYLMIFEYL